jgi:type 1 glutamine amidotransferase
MLSIAPEDYISDSGEEIWSILEERKLKNVILMGVHLNMCVLGRPFGLRQMARNGKTVALMRDMTDTMYNPARSPFVSHFAGTDLMVEHVEKYVAPSLTSDQILGGKPFRFSGDTRPRLAFVIADDEYQTEGTLPALASSIVRDYASSFVLGVPPAAGLLVGSNILPDADLLIVSARRRPLPRDQMALIRAHVAAGKPVVGLRTASHAFALRARTALPEGSEAWPGFDAEVLGGHYQGHHADGPPVSIALAPGAAGQPILEGVDPATLLGNGTLYKVLPLASTATPLLLGSIPGQMTEPVAWTNITASRGKVFYTSLGHPADFRQPSFTRLLKNAIDWAAGRESTQAKENH